MKSFNFLNIFNRSIYILFVISYFFVSCTKEEQPTNNIGNKSEIQTVPFFNLAKGDTIPKNIYRDKPLYKKNEATILFSTENTSKLKTTGNSVSFGEGYINNLYVSIRRDNSVGDWLWSGLRKIPVDLNEGAGGKWIYLFCSKGYTGELFEYCYNLRVCCSSLNDYGANYCCGESYVNKENGEEADLNDGAGGDYIYLIRQRNGYYRGQLKTYGPSPIKDILIASGNSSTFTVEDGWTKVPGDLNKGAGGKYIYIFYKR